MSSNQYRLADTLWRTAPALFITLQDEGDLEQYLRGFDSSDSLTESLPVSPFDYMEDVLEQDFRSHWLRFHECGIIRYELLNICECCKAVLMEHGWPDGDDSRLLRYAVITAISDYLEEGGENGL